MKKTQKLLVAAAALVTAVFMGCSLMDGATVTSESDKEKIQKYENESIRQVTAVVTNIEDIDSSAAPQTRTIMPSPNAVTYKYGIFGKSITGAIFAKQEVTIVDGKFAVALPAAAWELTLFAAEDDGKYTAITGDSNVQANASLVGYAFADLTNSSSEIKFTLTPDGLTGTGALNFQMILSNDGTSKWESGTLPGYTTTAQVQNMITGDKIAVTGITDDAITWSSGTCTYGSSTSTLAPGTYNFVVTFKNTATNLESVWSDILVVLPNKTCDRPVYIPKILGEIPANVTKLDANYISKTEDMNGGLPGYYLVHFQWDASSVNNERYFELQLGKVSTVTTTDTFTTGTGNATAWISSIDDANTTIYRPENFVNSQFKFAGSLFMNNTHCTLYVPLGEAYTARIRAVNNVGPSAGWTYLEFTDAALTLPSTTGLPTGAAATRFTAKDGTTSATTINRKRIEYNPNGGSYKSGAATKKTPKIEYSTLNALTSADREPYVLWAANIDELKYGSSKFVYWCDNVPAQVSDLSTIRVYKAVDENTDVSKAVNGGVIVEEDSADAGTADVTQKTGYRLTGTTALALMKTAATPVTGASPYTPTAALVQAKDKGGYIGVKNITFYADYSGDLTVDERDYASGYVLGTDWIYLETSGAGDYDGSAPVKTGLPTALYSSTYLPVSKATEASSSVLDLNFSVKFPDKAAATDKRATYTVGTGTDAKDYELYEELYKGTFTLVVKNQFGNEIFRTSKVGGGYASGDTEYTSLDFDAVPASYWENGIYQVEINVTAENKPTVTRSVRLTLAIKD